MTGNLRKMAFIYSIAKTLCLAMLFGVFLSSCIHLKPCGEDYSKIQTIFQTKKTKIEIDKREELCRLSIENQKQIDSLKQRVQNLEKQLKTCEEDQLLLETLLIDSKNNIEKCEETNKELLNKFEQLTSQNSADLSELQKELIKQRETLVAQENLLNIKEKELLNQKNLLELKEAEISEYRNVMKAQHNKFAELHSTVTQSLLGFEQDLEVENKDGKLYLTVSENLLFDSGSDKIKNKGKSILEKISKVLASNEDLNILVEGHTDNRPISSNRFKDNWELSSARANMVSKSLIEYGVKASNITSAARAEFSPIADNNTVSGRAKNRRTEIILTPDLSELYEFIEPKIVNGVKIIAVPEDADRYLIPMDKWNELNLNSDEKIISYLKNSHYYISSSNAPFKYLEDTYMVVIIKNMKCKFGKMEITLGHINQKNLKISDN